MKRTTEKMRKGSYGYHRQQTIRVAAAAAALYLVALAVYFAARHYLGTNQNLFTILAVVLLLPAAKITVNLIMLMRAGECPEEVHVSIEQHVGNLDNAYNLYCTTEKENYNLLHLAIGAKSIAALTLDPKCDCQAGEQHIRRMLTGNGIHGYQIKIFHTLPSYLTRLDQLCELEGEQGSDHEAVMQLLRQISL